MSSIEQLIESATRELEKTSSMSDMVGNRPHYPMWVAFNSAESESTYKIIYRKLERIWPQPVSKVMFSQYEANQDNLSVKDIFTGEDISPVEMSTKLDNVKKIQGIFAQMNQWCIYNVADTSHMNTIEEFEADYNIVEKLRNMVSDSSRVMLIVLLDDSTAKRDFVAKIREFLADKSNSAGTMEYDGIFVIANRTQNGQMYEMKDIYKIAANIIILSNNDAVSTNDDNDYNARAAGFYNKNVCTVSYLALGRPNDKIVFQIIDTILSKVQQTFEAVDKTYDLQKWRDKLGISNNKINICENYLAHLNIPFDISALDYLPLKSSADLKNFSVTNKSYAELQQYTYPEMLQEFVEKYFETEMLPVIATYKCIEDYKHEVWSKCTANELLEIDDETLEAVFNQLDFGTVNKGDRVQKYVGDYIKHILRKDIFSNKCKQAIRELKEEAEVTVREFKTFREDFQREIPIEGFADIGDMYSNITNSYLTTSSGKDAIRKIVSNGNNYQEIINQVTKIIQDIVEKNKDTISVSFIEEWSQRLAMAGDRVYREIGRTLQTNGRDGIYLSGNFPIMEKMQIYMYHTSNADGTRPTELYNYLNEAFKGVDNVQMFNTGFDDLLEVIKIVDCTGNNLRL